VARRRGTQVRIGTGAAVATVVALLVLGAPVDARDGSLAWGASCAEAAPAQATVNVGVVVDFGVLRGGDVQTTCVPLEAGTHGLKALQAAGHEITLDSSGLVCTIDREPAEGCGERTPGGYRYWAYFHGSGSSWSYSSIGPGGYRMAAGSVEGWHFVEGAGNPSDPPPGRAPTNICPTAPPPTVAPTTAPPPLPPPTTVPGPAPTVPGGGGPAGAPGAGGPSGASPSSTATTLQPGAPDGGATPTTDPTGEPAGSPPGTTDDASGSVEIGPDGVASDVTVLASAHNRDSGSEAGAPVATILAIVAVAGLGGAAAWRFRRRPDVTG
jgi:MYXO-CTERM domain-containing protein